MLIRDLSEIKDYVHINYATNPKDLKPGILRAEQKFIVPYLGKDQYKVIEAANNSNVLTTAQTDLLHYVSGALFNYAVLLSIPGQNVQINSSGVTQQHTEHSKPAFAHAIAALKASLIDAAFEWLESMLQFLEDNENDYPIWRNSSAYTKNKESFINTGARFNELYTIQCKIQTFHAIKTNMADMECFAILPTIGQAYFDELKTQIQAKSITSNNKIALNYIQHALANFTIANAVRSNRVSIVGNSVVYTEIIESNDSGNTIKAGLDQMIEQKYRHAKEMGERYLDKLRDHLRNNISDYPTYAAFIEESEEEDPCCSNSNEEYNPSQKNCNGNDSAVYVM